MFTIEFKFSDIAYVTFILDPYKRDYFFKMALFFQSFDCILLRNILSLAIALPFPLHIRKTS